MLTGGPAPPSWSPSRALGSADRIVAKRYRLVQLLGRGGQGEVWVADDEVLRIRVALKLLRCVSPTSAAFACREIAVLRMLRLPGVVRLRDEGFDGHVAFIAMDYIDGHPFPAAAVPCPWAAIASSTIALFETLARVHAAGVVHRDLKPANILIGKDGEVTLLDFGVSALGAEVPEADRAVLVGTPAYMAPEQFRGTPPCPQTDLYACGVLLFEALAGRLPHGDTTEDDKPLTKRHKRVAAALRFRAPPAITSVVDGVPGAVAAVIDRLLATEPRDRPRSASDVLAHLRGAAEAERRLPELGSDAPLEAILGAVGQRRSVDLGGKAGSGRTYWLRRAAAALERDGRRVVWTQRGTAPFSSLEPCIGALNEEPHETLPVVSARVEQRVRDLLSLHVVLMADDFEQLDRPSRTVLERCASAGAIVFARRRRGSSPHVDAPGRVSVRLEKLRREDLRVLFAGPDPLLHLREDASRLLAVRTEGSPAEIVAEIDAWTHAGLARWSEGKLHLDGDALERLEEGTTTYHGGEPWSARSGSNSVPSHLEELFAWVAMSWPFATIDLLHAASGAERWRVEAELDELVTRSLVFVDQAERTIVPRNRYRGLVPRTPTWKESTHGALARALPKGHPGRLLHLIASADPYDPAHALDVVEEAKASAAQRAAEGTLGKALRALEEGMRAARRLLPDNVEAVEGLLGRWVEIALYASTVPALDRVRYEIRRTEPVTPQLSRLARMVDAALHLEEWSARSLSILDDIGPFDDVTLELQRQGLRVVAARRNGVEQEVIASIGPWVESCGDPRARTSYKGWLGRLRYSQARYEEAAALHAEAAREESAAPARCSALLGAASAWVEAFDYALAQRAAEEALAVAEPRRLALLEMRARWVLRSMRYRRGEIVEPAADFVDAVTHIGAPDWEPVVLVTEAAIAWRAGSLDDARRLTRTAFERWPPTGNKAGRLLAAGLLAACGETLSSSERRDVVTGARACTAAGVGIQALALLAPLTASDEVPSAVVLDLASQLPRARWRTRLDVLSVDESLERLRVDVN